MVTLSTLREETFPGTRPEFLAFRALLRLGKIPDVDFTFQSSAFGGRTERGGLIIDFLFIDPPELAISVLGSYFHYVLGGGTQGRDLMTRAILAGEGITLIFVDDVDLEADAEAVMSNALRFQDNSQMVRIS